LSQLISVWWSDGILAALVVVSMAAPLESPRFLYQSATPEARTEGGTPPRRGRGRGLGSARMASGAAAGCGPVASSRFPFSASVLFFLFVRNNLLSKNERACVPRRDNGVRDGGFFFLGPKGKVVGLGCQARLLFSLCDWTRVGTPQDWTR